MLSEIISLISSIYDMFNFLLIYHHDDSSKRAGKKSMIEQYDMFKRAFTNKVFLLR